MDTLPDDLFSLIDNHLNCYQSVLLDLKHFDPNNMVKWAMYFYEGCHEEQLIAIYDKPDKSLIKVLYEILATDFGQNIRGFGLFKLGFRIGDERLIQQADVDINPLALQNCITEAITNNHTELVLKYDQAVKQSTTYKRMDAVDNEVIQKFIAAYRSKNQRIIDHIVANNKVDINTQYAQLFVLLIQAKNTEFMEAFGARRWSNYNSLIFIRLSIEEDNNELCEFLIGGYKRVLHDPNVTKLEIMMRANKLEKMNQVFEMIEPVYYKRLIDEAYVCGCKQIFDKITALNPNLTHEIDIFYSMESIGIDILKIILAANPPSKKEISTLKTKSLSAYRYDVYCYLCSIEFIVDEHNKYLAQYIINFR